MFSWYKYLIVDLVVSHLGFWSGNLFLIAPFSDLCLLVPFDIIGIKVIMSKHKLRLLNLMIQSGFLHYENLLMQYNRDFFINKN